MSKLIDKNLAQDAEHVIDNLAPLEAEIRIDEVRCYLRRIRPSVEFFARTGDIFATCIATSRVSASFAANSSRLRDGILFASRCRGRLTTRSEQTLRSKALFFYGDRCTQNMFTA